MAQQLKVDVTEARRLAWRNLARITHQLGISDLLPKALSLILAGVNTTSPAPVE